MKENKTKYSVLGILSYGPKSGYDIKKFYQQSIAGFWSESYGQIYPILKRLAEEGLATKSIQKQEGKPDRHIYAITDKGREELQRWLVEPIGRYIGRHEILLKLIFGRQISLNGNIIQIERFRERQLGELKEVERLRKRSETQKTDDPNLPYWLLAFDYGKHVNEAYIQWAEKALAALHNMENKTSSRKEKK
ncbi:Transcriptional regulator, PadR family [Olavius sp. associated proteobacterium Delta 1]|nr:Transcriptional regulator, PadR family [Olavius sp. associated proteobacterium Delta 1]